MGLAPDWLNNGPTSQIQSGLPAGFRERVETRIYRSLVVHIASRLDQIHLKLFAIVDQGTAAGKHGEDLRQLNPSRDELITAAKWVMNQDAGEAFRRLVIEALRAVGVEDAESEL
jgi:hypothetical protein